MPAPSKNKEAFNNKKYTLDINEEMPKKGGSTKLQNRSNQNFALPSCMKK
jgi:hypothetical protein